MKRTAKEHGSHPHMKIQLMDKITTLSSSESRGWRAIR
jgi:hypothetical protein